MIKDVIMRKMGGRFRQNVPDTVALSYVETRGRKRRTAGSSITPFEAEARETRPSPCLIAMECQAERVPAAIAARSWSPQSAHLGAIAA